MEEELKDTMEAGAAQRRVKEYQDKAAARGRKRTKSSLEETQMDAPTTSTMSTRSSSGGAAPVSSSDSSSANAAKPVSPPEDCESSKASNKRKADGEHFLPPVETRNPRVLSSLEPTPEEHLRRGGAQGGSGSSPPSWIPNRGVQGEPVQMILLNIHSCRALCRLPRQLLTRAT